jgi:hypothetical protein
MTNSGRRLNFKTSEFGRKTMVRSASDMNEPETACTPFCEVVDVKRDDHKCYVTLRVDRDGSFHAYLASIGDQIRSFLGADPPIRMPYDPALGLLRVKFPVRGGRLAVRAWDAALLQEVPTSSLAPDQRAALSMTLHKLYMDADVVTPTWVADTVLVRVPDTNVPRDHTP